MGILQTMPLVVVLAVEKGVVSAVSEILFMMLSGGPLYFIFHIQTKCFYFAQTILAGGASYKPTGRGFVIRHSPFDENYRFFATSHIYLGFEIMCALLLIARYSTSKQYGGLTWSLWMTAVSFMFSPFWFNPLSFEWNKVSEDYHIWMRWMTEHGGTSDQSWYVWWKEETAFLSEISLSWKVSLFVTRACLWIFVGIGLTGTTLFTDPQERGRMLAIIGLFVLFVSGHWCLSKLERSLSYAIRRLSSFLLTSAVAGLAIYLYAQSLEFVTLTIGLYYFCAAAVFVLLLSGVQSVAYICKLHDYLVGHFIFLVLVILSLCQVGMLQTWLLYHNALSAGVAIEDVLKYARKSKETAESDEQVTVTELKTQLLEQQKVIQSLLLDRDKEKSAGGHSVAVTELEMAKRGLLSGLAGKSPQKSYGAVSTEHDNLQPHKSGQAKIPGRHSASVEQLAPPAPFVFVQPSSFPVRANNSQGAKQA